MKLILILLLVLYSAANGFSQEEKLQTGDSIRVAVERTALSGELVQLRDSILQSLKTFSARIKKLSTSNGKKFKAAQQELLQYHSQVKLDLKEISLTAQKSWTKESVDRIRAAAVVTRLNYKRICAIL